MDPERAELLQQYHAETDPKRKALIQNRILQMDAQASPVSNEDLLRALSWPQERLKEFVNPEGGGKTWGVDRPVLKGSVLGLREEYASPEAAEFALDIGLDPIDLVTAGLAKGYKGMKALTGGAKAGKGGFTASFSNYVDNYYGTPADAVPTGFEAKVQEPVAKMFEKVSGKKVPEESQLSLLRKAKGMANTLFRGTLNGLESLTNAESQALWREFGINKATQRILKRHLKALEEGGDRAIQKGVAQTQYTRHIGEQAGREGPIHPALATLTDEMSNLENYVDYEPGAFSRLMRENDAIEVTGTQVKDYGGGKTRKSKKTASGFVEEDVVRDYKISKQDADFIEQHIMETSGKDGVDKIVFKRPEQRVTGKHKYDVLGQKNPGYRVVEGAFKDLIAKGENVTTDLLEDALRGRIKSTKSDGPINIRPSGDGGFWIDNGTRASSITEGGINSLIKVTPDGQVMGVMSDKHDWLEKILRKLKLENKLLPNSLVAVSPPMYKNVYDSSYVQKAGRKAGVDLPKGPTKKTAKGSAYETPHNDPFIPLLEELTQAQPSAPYLGTEYLKRGTMLGGAASIYNRTQQEQQ